MKSEEGPVPSSHVEYNNLCASLGHYSRAGAFADTLNQMLTVAENESGPCDRAFTIWNVEFTRPHPSLYGLRFGAKVVTIILSRGVLAAARKGDWRNAYWEPAHEWIHLLSPPMQKGPIVLEEGFACSFQRRYMQEHLEFARPQGLASHASAEAKTQELRDRDDDITWKLRQEEPAFRGITAATARPPPKNSRRPSRGRSTGRPASSLWTSRCRARRLLFWSLPSSARSAVLEERLRHEGLTRKRRVG